MNRAVTNQDPNALPPVSPHPPYGPPPLPPHLSAPPRGTAVPPPPAPRSGGAGPGVDQPAPPTPHAPSIRTGSQPTPPTGGRRSLIAIAIAITAVVVASVSVVISWRALDQAGDARDIANARGLQAPAATQAPTTGSTAEPPPVDLTGTPIEPVDPAVTGTLPTLNAQTQYAVKYTGESLKMLVAGCADEMYIDLDEPRLRVGLGSAELSFETECSGGTPTLKLVNGVVGSEVESPVTTPAECNEKIRTSPLGEIAQPARRGRVFCVMTNLDLARASGDTWKMVVVEVKSTAQDGTVTIQANAWNIPN